MVYRLKKDFDYLNIEINGGFKTVESIKDALTKVDGVMIGRAAYEDYRKYALQIIWTMMLTKQISLLWITKNIYIN